MAVKKSARTSPELTPLPMAAPTCLHQRAPLPTPSRKPMNIPSAMRTTTKTDTVENVPARSPNTRNGSAKPTR